MQRKFESLEWFAALGTTPISHFGGLLVAFPVADNIKMFVSGYQSIHMHCIVMPVKFDGGLSISFLRNRQPLTKKREGQKITFSIVQIFNVQTPPSEERTDHGKSLTFLTLIFLVNGISDPTSNLAQTQKCFLSID
jgi:hypothetical protein